MIEAIFYARFDHERGPVVLHESPLNSVKPPNTLSTDHTTSNGATRPVLDFDAISAYVIPPQEFCDQLVSVVTNGYRVLGHPVCISDEKYPRNEFIFNFVIVVKEKVDFEKYDRLVRKLAQIGREVEARSEWLSKDESDYNKNEAALSRLRLDKGDASDTVPASASASISGGGLTDEQAIRNSTIVADNEVDEQLEGASCPSLSDLIASAAAKASRHDKQSITREQGSRVRALIAMLREDINCYGECLIPIDSSTMLNTKLFPTLPPPPPVKPEHVPFPTVRPLSKLTDSNWDLTVLRILPFIDGINSVSQIGQLADADLRLTSLAIAHLVYYGTVVLMNIFHFGAVYVPTDRIRDLLLDTKVLDECIRFARKGESGGPQIREPLSDEERARVTELYTSLKHGVALRSWVAENWLKLEDLDVRRLVTIGLVKGLLTRIHRYPVLVNAAKGTDGTSAPLSAAVQITANQAKEGKKKLEKDASVSQQTRDLRFAPYLDGLHSLDRICTDLQMPEKEALEELKRWGDVVVVHR